MKESSTFVIDMQYKKVRNRLIRTIKHVIHIVQITIARVCYLGFRIELHWRARTSSAAPKSKLFSHPPQKHSFIKASPRRPRALTQVIRFHYARGDGRYNGNGRYCNDGSKHQNKMVLSRWKSDDWIPYNMGLSTTHRVYRFGHPNFRSFGSYNRSRRRFNTPKPQYTVPPLQQSPEQQLTRGSVKIYHYQETRGEYTLET